MSIAEQIMLGTQQQSKNWSVLSENLGRLGREVGNQLALEQYQKQAAEALPAMQQQMQAALQDAGSGRSADAYSKLLPLISNPAYNQNPILLPGLEYIMKATKDASDNFLTSQKTQQGSELSLADAFIASQLGMPLPQKPGAVTTPAAGGVGTGQPPTNNQPTTDTSKLPVYGNDKPIAGKHLQEIDIMNLQPQETGEFTVPIPMASGKTMYGRYLTALPVQDGQAGGDQQVQPTSETQVRNIKDVEAISNKLIAPEGKEGKTFAESMGESSQMIWDKSNISPYAKSFKRIDGLDRYIQGAEGITVLEQPDVLRQKGMNVSTNSGVSLSFENIDPNYDYQKNSTPFEQKITDNIAILNDDDDLQTAINKLGGFENISFITLPRNQGYAIRLPDGKKVQIDKDTLEAARFVGAIPQSAKNAMMPLYGTEINIPAPNVRRNKQNLKELEGRVGTDPKTGKKFKIVNGTPVAVD
jgi:hypothetical protein